MQVIGTCWCCLFSLIVYLRYVLFVIWRLYALFVFCHSFDVDSLMIFPMARILCLSKLVDEESSNPIQSSLILILPLILPTWNFLIYSYYWPFIIDDNDWTTWPVYLFKHTIVAIMYACRSLIVSLFVCFVYQSCRTVLYLCGSNPSSHRFVLILYFQCVPMNIFYNMRIW